MFRKILVFIIVCLLCFITYTVMNEDYIYNLAIENINIINENYEVKNEEYIGNIERPEIEKRDELQTNVVLENVQPPMFSNTIEENTETEEDEMEDCFYYEQLNNYGKIIYAKLTNEYENLKTGTAKIDFGKQFNSAMQTEEGRCEIEESFQAALNAIFYDRPEFFFLESTKMYFYTESTTRGTKTTYSTYIAPAENATYLKDEFESESDVNRAIRKIENITKDIILDAGNNKYEIIKSAHDWIIENTEYDSTISLANIRDIYGVFENGVAVCAGYANAFKYILDRAGITCIYVPGDATNEEGTEAHAWNYVKLDNRWYFVDCTWDDPIIRGATYRDTKIRTDYFLKGRKTVANSHIPRNKAYGSIVFEWPELYELDYKK